MELKPDFAFTPLPPLDDYTHHPFPPISHPLGALKDLPGTWVGTGFNVIWRPNHTPESDHFLELNLTSETIEFDVIPGSIPNRGLLQKDIAMFGVRYLQQISDSNLHAGLHVEPGIWVTIPETTDPAEKSTVARMASIPHGTTILAQGVPIAVANTQPIINPVDITPFVIGNPADKIPFPNETTLSHASAFRSPAAQLAGVTQAMVDNPNSVLSSALVGQTIANMNVFVISTVPATPLVGGGTDNTAFLQGSTAPNAQSASMSAIFWIEKVEGSDELQLQYTQTVLLNFKGLSWPHVTVATLRKKVEKFYDPKIFEPKATPDVF